MRKQIRKWMVPAVLVSVVALVPWTSHAEVEIRRSADFLPEETPWSKLEPFHLRGEVYETVEGGLQVKTDEYLRVSVDMNHLAVLPAGTQYVWFYKGKMMENLQRDATKDPEGREKYFTASEFVNPLIWSSDRDNCNGANGLDAEAQQRGDVRLHYDIDETVCRVELQRNYPAALAKHGVVVKYESTQQLDLLEGHTEFAERNYAPYEVKDFAWSFSPLYQEKYYTRAENVLGRTCGYRRYASPSYQEWFFRLQENELVKEVRCHKAYRTMHHYRHDHVRKRCTPGAKLARRLQDLSKVSTAGPLQNGPGASRRQCVEIEKDVSYELFKRGDSSVYDASKMSQLTWGNTNEALGDFIKLPRPYGLEIVVSQ